MDTVEPKIGWKHDQYKGVIENDENGNILIGDQGNNIVDYAEAVVDIRHTLILKAKVMVTDNLSLQNIHLYQ